jgi:hypothetical protein
MKRNFSHSKRVQLEKVNSIMKASREVKNPVLPAKVYYSYLNGIPDLAEGCWYIGQVVNFSGTSPIVLHGASKVLLRKNGEQPPKVDDLVVYEVKEVGTSKVYAAIGDYKQSYSD